MSEIYVTKDVCKEKHDNTARECGQIRTQVHEHTEKIQEIDVRFAELSGDVKHIKNRIDNGISTSINEIKTKMDDFMPLVKESYEWAGRFKQAVYFLAVISFGGGVVSLAFYLVRILTEGAK